MVRHPKKLLERLFANEPNNLIFSPPTSHFTSAKNTCVDVKEMSADDIYRDLKIGGQMLYLQLPDDVKIIVDKLRKVQEDKRSEIFDQRLSNGEYQSPFMALESALMSILTLVPTILLSNSHENSRENTVFDYENSSRRNSYGRVSPFSHSQINLGQNSGMAAVKRYSISSFRTSHGLQCSGDDDDNASIRSVASVQSTIAENVISSSLAKILGASSLLTSVISTVISMHNEDLVRVITDIAGFDQYYRLTEQVSAEAEAIRNQIRAVKDNVMHARAEDTRGQGIYSALVVHSNRLVDSLSVLAEFVEGLAPLMYEVKTKVARTFSSLKRTAVLTHVLMPDMNGDSIPTHCYTGYNYDCDRRRTKSIASVASTASTASTASVASVYTLPTPLHKPRKISFSDTSRLHRHIIPPRIHIPPNQPGLASRHSVHPYTETSESDSPSTVSAWHSIPSTPATPNTPRSSRFKEHFDALPALITPSLVGRRRRMSETADVGHPKSLYLQDNRSAKSIMSYVEPNRSDVHLVKEKGSFPPLNSSKPGFKNYLMKRVVKKKSEEDRANSYWPVNESGSMPSLPTGRKMPSGFYASQKMQRICSDGDLRLLRRQWGGENNSSGESVGGHLSGFTGDSEDSGGLREHLFHRIVKKKSSQTSLSAALKNHEMPKSMQYLSYAHDNLSERDAVEYKRVYEEKLTEATRRKLFIVDDEPEQAIDSRRHIQAETIENLLEHLIYVDDPDPEFVDCFVLCHAFFMGSHTFLEFLIVRYSSHDEYAHVGISQETVQSNILKVLYRWTLLQHENFIDENLHSTLDTFVESLVNNNVLNGIRHNLQQAQVALTRRPSIPNLQSSMISVVDRLYLSETSPLLDFESRVIAKYLTLIDFAAFKNITLYEYITGWWRKRKGFNSGEEEQVESGIDVFTRRANMMSHWVAYEICSLKTIKARRTLLHKFIEAARHCRDWNNFHTSMCIVLALNSRPVRRLEKTWLALSNKDLLTLQNIEKLMDVSGNMRNYRKALAHVRAPAVPFFDLTVIMEGNPTFTPAATDMSNSSTQQLVNFEKFRLLTRNVLNMKAFTSEAYSFSRQLSQLPSIVPTYELSVSEEGRKGALDHVGEIIEKRILVAAGDMFDGSVASIAKSDGAELEAELMTLSLKAEPNVCD
ncbi:8859_t:CDS:10 [Paraglomus occultum]|uniref:8859_t:CDS:1 n=1 Tax=Paraglomus occultum TaxID=144539 RepID=A0A9N9CAH2_9GLOM|nr:8859_t:CDS:10 [Paraglomus occultum]